MKAKPQRKQMKIAFAYLSARWKVAACNESPPRIPENPKESPRINAAAIQTVEYKLNHR